MFHQMVYESLYSWMVRMSGVGEWKCQGAVCWVVDHWVGQGRLLSQVTTPLTQHPPPCLAGQGMELDLDEEGANLGVRATTNWRKRVEAIFSRGGTSRPPTTRAALLTSHESPNLLI